MPSPTTGRPSTGSARPLQHGRRRSRSWRASNPTRPGRQETADALAGDLRDLEMLDPGEDEEDILAATRTRLANSRNVAEAMDIAAAALSGDHGVDDGLATASAALVRIRDVAGGLVDDALDRRRPRPGRDRGGLVRPGACGCGTRGRSRPARRDRRAPVRPEERRTAPPDNGGRPP